MEQAFRYTGNLEDINITLNSDEKITLDASQLQKPMSPITLTSQIGKDPDAIAKPKKGRKKKETTEVIVEGATMEAKPAPQPETTTVDKYDEPIAIYRSVIQQSDMIGDILQNEINKLAMNTGSGKFTSSKTRNMDLASFADAFARIVSNKSQAADKIAGIIKNSMEYDYKCNKDNKENDSDDIRAITNMYRAMAEMPPTESPDLYKGYLGGNLSLTFNESGVPVRPDQPAADSLQQRLDSGYNQYMQNLTPAQNYMLNENNPNIKQVVFENVKTGDAWFSWIDMTTMQEVPNMPVKSNNYLFDKETIFDRASGKVILTLFNQTYDLIQIDQ